MALGLALGGDNCQTNAGRKAVSDAISAFADAFRQRHGALACRNLLGCDVSTPEGLKAALDQGLFRTRCVTMVHDAAEILEDLLPSGQAV